MTIKLPDGATELEFEELEGLILIHARLRGMAGRDTSGFLVFDTGSGYLALDRDLARWCGVLSTRDTAAGGESMRAGKPGVAGKLGPSGEAEAGLASAERPLVRLELGTLQLDQVFPLTVMDGEIVRAALDRPVLGLMGQSLLRSSAVAIDYPRRRMVLVSIAPSSESKSRDSIERSREALEFFLTKSAVPVAFELLEDGKILAHARIRQVASAAAHAPRAPGGLTTNSVGDATEVDLIVDTGAAKAVLFDDAPALASHPWRNWRLLEGLAAPTLFGEARASIAFIPRIELDGAVRSRAPGDRERNPHTEPPIGANGVDAVLLNGELHARLERAMGRKVDGLLGASFLRRFRVAIDYPHRVLWLDAIRLWVNPRPFEYCTIGVQLERRGQWLTVVGVARRSPAADAGVELGDVLRGVDGLSPDSLDLTRANRALEGRPGTKVRVEFARGSEVHKLTLIRRELL